MHVLQEATAHIGLEVQVMTAIAGAEAAGETGNYCMAVAVAADCEFDVQSAAGLDMTAAIVRCKIDNRSSVGPVQDKEVVHILAVDSGTDCC